MLPNCLLPNHTNIRLRWMLSSFLSRVLFRILLLLSPCSASDFICPWHVQLCRRMLITFERQTTFHSIRVVNILSLSQILAALDASSESLPSNDHNKLDSRCPPGVMSAWLQFLLPAKDMFKHLSWHCYCRPGHAQMRSDINAGGRDRASQRAQRYQNSGDHCNSYTCTFSCYL